MCRDHPTIKPNPSLIGAITEPSSNTGIIKEFLLTGETLKMVDFSFTTCFKQMTRKRQHIYSGQKRFKVYTLATHNSYCIAEYLLQKLVPKIGFVSGKLK